MTPDLACVADCSEANVGFTPNESAKRCECAPDKIFFVDACICPGNQWVDADGYC